MALFRCCTAFSYAPVSLDKRCPPHLLGRGAVSHELLGVTGRIPYAQPRVYHRSHPTLPGLTPPGPSSMHLLRASLGHPHMSSNLSSPQSITRVRPPGYRLLFLVDSGSGYIPIALYMRPERRSRTANRFPTDNLLDRGSMTEHVRRLGCCEAFYNTLHAPHGGARP